MTLSKLGRQRADGIYRIAFGAIILGTAGLIPGAYLALGIAAAVVYHVLDVIMQVLFNRGMGGDVSDGLRTLYEWPLGQLEWLFFSGRSFPWLPWDV